jgi:hypothetical protein
MITTQEERGPEVDARDDGDLAEEVEYAQHAY